MKTTFRVIVGDFDQVYNFDDDESAARKKFNSLPKGTRPSNYRALEKIEVLEDDYNS